jgi:hypothetical protein
MDVADIQIGTIPLKINCILIKILVGYAYVPSCFAVLLENKDLAMAFVGQEVTSECKKACEYDVSPLIAAF